MNLPPKQQLAKLFNTKSFDISRCAHLCIDVQERFCDTKLLRNRAKHIAQNIVPAFNKLNIPTYYIWYGHYSDEEPDFLEVAPTKKEQSRIIRKNAHSAFAGSNLHDVLQQRRINTLLVSGFYIDHCVEATAIHARKNNRYGVIILKDATDFERNFFLQTRLESREIGLHHANEILPLLEEIRKGKGSGDKPVSQQQGPA